MTHRTPTSELADELARDRVSGQVSLPIRREAADRLRELEQSIEFAVAHDRSTDRIMNATPKQLDVMLLRNLRADGSTLIELKRRLEEALAHQGMTQAFLDMTRRGLIELMEDEIISMGRAAEITHMSLEEWREFVRENIEDVRARRLP